MADVNLTADAQQLVRQFEFARQAVASLRVETGRLAADQIRNNRQGQAVQRNLEIIGRAGQRAAIQLRDLGGNVRQAVTAFGNLGAAARGVETRLTRVADRFRSAAAVQRDLAEATRQASIRLNEQASIFTRAQAAQRESAARADAAARQRGLAAQEGTQGARIRALRQQALAERAQQQEARAAQVERLRFIDQERRLRLRAIADERRARQTLQQQIRQQAAEQIGFFGQLRRVTNTLFRAAGISLFIGAVFELQQALRNAASAAADLSIRIAEVQTISTNAAFSTGEWADELRNLSNQFGIDTLKQAEGAYQILSNQIRNVAGQTVQGADALKVLDAANRLAVTGVTDTANATNLLTAALNSFRIPAEDSETVAAKLFKTVELGRLRVADLANIFGRVAVPARQLGLSIDEVLGSITQLTIQGVRADEAVTLLRNIILKLIRPTDRLKAVFGELGVSSGTALIQTRGFIPALQLISERVGDSAEGIGEAFGRIRAITGTLGLVGENADRAAASIDKIRNATTQAFQEDTNKIINSTGQQLKIAGQEARNFFEREIGTPALQAIAKIIKELGGMENILRTTVDTIKLFAKFFLLSFGASRLVALFNLARGITAVEAATKAATAAQLAYNRALALSPIGVFATIGVAIAAVTEIIKRAANSRLKAQEDANIAILKGNQELQRQINNATKANTKAFEQEIDRRVRLATTFFTDLAKIQSARAKALQADAQRIGKLFTVVLTEFKKNVTSQLTEASREVKKFTKTAEDAARLAEQILAREGRVQFQIDFTSAGLGQRIGLLEREILAARERVAKAIREGDLKAFQEQRKRLNELIKQRIESEVKFARESSRLSAALEEARIRQVRARSRQEKELADERVKDLERQNKILREGTSAQLKQEQELQKVRQQGRQAQDAAAFKAALEQLAALKREQERINALASIERRIRKQSAEEAARQAKQAAEIARINKERADQARREEQRLRALQLVFNLISKEAENFNQKRVTEGKTSTEINKAIAEQQKRFASLITLARQITGGRELDLIITQRDLALRQQGQVRINQLEEQARQKETASLQNTLKERLRVANEANKRELKNLDSLQRSVVRFQQLQSLSLLRTDRDAEARGRTIRQAFARPSVIGPGGETAESLKQLSKQFDQNVTLAKELNRLVNLQRKEFKESRQQQIKNIVEVLTRNLRTDVQRGQASIARLRQQRAFISPQRQDIVQTSAALLSSIQRIAASTEQLGKQQSDIQRIINLLPNLSDEVFKSTKAVQRELTAREKHVKALREATEAANRLNKILSGQRITTGPAAVPGPVRPAELKNVIGQLETKPVTESVKKAVKDGLKEGPRENRKNVENEFKKGVRKGTSDGIKSGTKDAEPDVKRAAQKAGRDQAKAKADAEIDVAPELSRQIAKLEADIKARQARVQRATLTLPTRQPPTFQRRQIDTTIRLGRGAPSLQSQQTRIAAALQKERERELEFLKAKRKFDKEERERAQARAIAQGLVRAGGPTGLVSVGGGNIDPRTGALTTGRGGGGNIDPLTGRLVSRGIIQPRPIEKKQLTTAEKTEKNTKDTVTAIRELRQPGRQTSTQALRVARGLPPGPARPQPSAPVPTPTPRRDPLGLGRGARIEGRRLTTEDRGILTRGEEEARKELRRVLLGQTELEKKRLKTAFDLDVLDEERKAEIQLNRDLLRLNNRPQFATTQFAEDESNLRKDLTDELKKTLRARRAIPATFDPRQQAGDPRESRNVFERIGGTATRGQLTPFGPQPFKQFNEATVRLTEASKTLKEAADKQKQTPTISLPQPFASGGAVRGPLGTDKVPAMLTSGEFVVRRERARRFFPQLMAMNFGKLRPARFQQGGPVDVGGIRVSVTESSTPQATAGEVVRQINRGLRQGTFKLRTT